MALFVDNGKPLAEFPGVPDIACSGLGRVEFLPNGQACFVLYRNLLAANSAALEQQACARIYGPLAAASEASELLVRALIEGGLVEGAELASRLLM